MFTEKNFKNTIWTYFGFAIFCIVFAVIYTKLGHGVVSWPLRLSFVFPALAGSFLYFYLKNLKNYERISFNLFNASIATFTVWGIYQGVIEIAGADTEFGKYYLIFGGILMILSFVFRLLRK